MEIRKVSAHYHGLFRIDDTWPHMATESTADAGARWRQKASCLNIRLDNSSPNSREVATYYAVSWQAAQGLHRQSRAPIMMPHPLTQKPTHFGAGCSEAKVMGC